MVQYTRFLFSNLQDGANFDSECKASDKKRDARKGSCGGTIRCDRAMPRQQDATTVITYKGEDYIDSPGPRPSFLARDSISFLVLGYNFIHVRHLSHGISLSQANIGSSTAFTTSIADVADPLSFDAISMIQCILFQRKKKTIAKTTQLTFFTARANLL